MNQMKSIAINGNSKKYLTLSGLLAAMIALTTAFLFHIPIGSNSGYIHFGDTFIYLAACLLPTPYACAAAAIGGGLADLMSGAAIWMLPTMIIKPLTALCFRRSDRFFTVWNLFATVAAGCISLFGYYLAEVLLTGNWLAPLATAWGSVVQSTGSAVLFIVMGIALDKSNLKHRI